MHKRCVRPTHLASAFASTILSAFHKSRIPVQPAKVCDVQSQAALKYQELSQPREPGALHVQMLADQAQAALQG